MKPDVDFEQRYSEREQPEVAAFLGYPEDIEAFVCEVERLLESEGLV